MSDMINQVQEVLKRVMNSEMNPDGTGDNQGTLEVITQEDEGGNLKVLFKVKKTIKKKMEMEKEEQKKSIPNKE